MRISDWSSDVCSSDLETVGLTSTAHVDALAAQGIYDRVISYDQIMTLSAATPAALVDMAGNGAVTRVVHSHFGNNLKASIVVGKSHWDAQADVERSEEHTSELQSLMRISYAVLGLKKNKH